MTPRITVIIPTYNWSSVLPYSIGSVLRQTRTDWELWVAGDGCTDDSEQVVARFGDPRIHWLNLEKNTGQQGAPINAALKHARGEFIAYLGHDDVWLPHHLEVLAGTLEAGADMAFGWVSLILPDGKREVAPQQKYKPGIWIPPTGTMHRKSWAEKIGPWKLPSELKLDPETDYWKRLADAGARCEEVRRVTALKFPAARRRNVYRERPSHEQEEAFRRIGESPDVEREELALIVADSRKRFGEILRDQMKARLRNLRKRLFGYQKGIHLVRRRFKGLPME